MMSAVPRSMAAGAVVVVTAAWRRLRRRESHESDIATRGRSERAACGSSPDDAALTSTTMTYEPRIRELSGIETDEHPRLVAEAIADEGRDLVAFYESEDAGYDGEVIVIEERDMAEVRR